MPFEDSIHWSKKKVYRKDITYDLIGYCIQKSHKIRDKYWEDAWNAVFKIPQTGRTLKVVYKTKGKTIKILTAYWLD